MKAQRLLIAAGIIAASFALTACGGGDSSPSDSSNNNQKPPVNNKPVNPPAQPVTKGTCVEKAAGAMSYALSAGESCTLVSPGIGSVAGTELSYTCKNGVLLSNQSGISITVTSGTASLNDFTLTCKK